SPRRPPGGRWDWPGARRAGRRWPFPRRAGCPRREGWCGWRSCSTAPVCQVEVGWKGEVEGGALAGRGLGPDAPIVPCDHAFDAREADAGAGELARGVQALEDAEQLAGIEIGRAHV